LVQPGTDFQNARIQATIKAASVNTGNDRRDNHLRSDDFFNATQYPEITFASTAFEKIGDSAYTITGDLTIRDVTQPVVLQAVYRGMVVDPRGNIKAGFQATGTINRQDFGVRWNKALDTGGVVVSDEVTILLDVILKQVKRDSL
jgi:polyisoprenoid-binding protein YceI